MKPFLDLTLKGEKKYLKISLILNSGDRSNASNHLEFAVSHAVILLLLENHRRHLSSVLTKTFLGAYPKMIKFSLIASKIKSGERRNSQLYYVLLFSLAVILLFLKNLKTYLSSVLNKTLLGACSIRLRKIINSFRNKVCRVQHTD